MGYDTELSKVSFTLRKGERLAVLGENGKGKSTLLKTLVGILEALGGSFTFGQNVEWGYFDQQIAVVNNTDPEQTVLDNFWEEYPKLLREEVRSALGSFMFSQEEVMKKIGQLSGGEKVRLALCKMFQTKPNLLILDEPTNHMDIMGKQALEQMLQNFKGTVLFVSHDRYFIKQVATEILEFGQEKVSQYHCDYEEYLNEKAKIATESSKVQSPVSQDVSDKKTYYNPGKIKSRLIKQLEKYEKQLQESEEKAASLKIEMMAPELATDYHKLMELQSQLEKEETWQESLLEQIMETETELEELKNDN
jgi:ATP-binding cassette subfamily F protein 3